jgi:hypothetical protein
MEIINSLINVLDKAGMPQIGDGLILRSAIGAVAVWAILRGQLAAKDERMAFLREKSEDITRQLTDATAALRAQDITQATLAVQGATSTNNAVGAFLGIRGVESPTSGLDPMGSAGPTLYGRPHRK